MEIRLRPATTTDETACGRIVYDAFKDVSGRHGFPPAFPTPEVALGVVRFFLGLTTVHSVVAEADGRPVGAVFHDEGDEIHGVALVAVDPAAQGHGVGRRLMEASLERARGASGVRLVQEAYNVQALALYASLGFEVKEPLVRVTGRPRGRPDPGVEVRPLGVDDLDECARLSQRVHGFHRSVDLRDALRAFRPLAVVRDGRITACTYVLFAGTLAWGVAETEDDMRALLLGVAGAVEAPLALLLPTRQASLFRWCLSEGLRAEKPLTLMVRGRYQKPCGCYFPSGIY
jgi:GNAT superfamily N-acetyltransferase